MGHQDIVVRLPPDRRAAGIDGSCREQAFTFLDKPIYCTQFHPELNREAVLERVQAYPQYIERVARVSLAEFIAPAKTHRRPRPCCRGSSAT